MRDGRFLAVCLGAKTDIGITPPIGEDLADEGMGMIGEYTTQRNKSVSHYITTQPIFDIVVAEERWSGFPETM